MPQYRFSIVACARWENDYIAEWLVFHRAAGCEHVYLYCNDDEPSGLYASALAHVQEGYVTFVHYPVVGMQRLMYLHFLANYRHQSEWIIFIDIDEFIHVVDNRPISHFIEGFEHDWDCIYLNWLMRGAGGFLDRPGGSVLLQYTRRASEPHVYTKGLIRTSAIPDDWISKNPVCDFWHNWQVLPNLRMCNVLGEDMRCYYEAFPDGAFRFLQQGNRHTELIAIARIDHFAFRSERDFLRRAERGMLGDFVGQGRWAEMYHEGVVRAFLEHLEVVEDCSLAMRWSHIVSPPPSACAFPRPPLVNVAVNRPARQSSFAAGADAAGEAVNGVPCGRFQFRTRVELKPWWEVKLAEAVLLRQILLFADLQYGRSFGVPVQFEAWLDETGWTAFHSDLEPRRFGGVDGDPYVWMAHCPVIAAGVRVSLLGVAALGLDQVEVYA